VAVFLEWVGVFAYGCCPTWYYPAPLRHILVFKAKVYFKLSFLSTKHGHQSGYKMSYAGLCWLGRGKIRELKKRGK
jgi:hypothetical protein